MTVFLLNAMPGIYLANQQFVKTIEVARHELETTAKAVALAIETEDTNWKANGMDLQYVKVYNSKGLLEKIIYYHSNIYTGFSNLHTCSYTYDNNGKKHKEVIEYPQMPQNPVDSTVYFYDNNRLIREDKYEDGYFGSEPWRSVLVTYTEYEYDNQGKLVKETIYSGTDKKPVQFSKHSYQNGLNVKTEIFNINNIVYSFPNS